MPTVTLNRKVVEQIVGKLPLAKLKDRISYLGTDLEEVGSSEIVVEVFPNRPDMLSEQGFARAFAGFLGKKKGLHRYPVKASGEKVIIDKSVSKVRPYTACAIVRGLKYTDERIREIIQVQEKLHVTYGRNRRKAAIGIYPFEKIEPPIRYLAKKPSEIKFRPLESAGDMTAQQILLSHQTGKDYGHLLDGAPLYPLFIDSKGQILSMPPVVNSHTTGKIGSRTRDVFIECSGFDLEVLRKCINIIVAAMHEMGGKIYSMKLQYPDRTITTPDMRPGIMKVDRGYINKWLGISLTEAQMKGCLERMGFAYSKGRVQIPAYRTDILHQCDLAEDIAIAYGYDNFRPIIPNVATVGQEDPFEAFKDRIAEILIGLGLLEVKTYNLTNSEKQNTMMGAGLPLIRLANSMSAEYDVLRAWVLPSMLEIFSNNKHHDYPQKIFGTGTVFKKNTRMETNIEENERLAVALCHERADFTEARQVLDYLMRQIDIEYDVREAEHDSFIPGRVARVSVKGKDVAYLGEISPRVLENFSIEMPVSCFELNLSQLHA